MIKIAVLDDVREDLDKICALVESFAQTSNFPLEVKAFDNPFDLLDYTKKNGGFALYLLDIVMLQLTGIDVAEELRKRGESAEIVFITSSCEYGIDAFGVNAVGYLVKPVSEKEFNGLFGRVIGKISADAFRPVYIKVNGGIRRVTTDEIVMIESFNHKRSVKLSDGRKIVTPTTLSEFGRLLKPFREFDSPHRAYIINLNYVTGMQGYDLFISDDCVPIAKSTYRKFKENYIKFCFER